jgi:hypothetical protein
MLRIVKEVIRDAFIEFRNDYSSDVVIANPDVN